VHRLLRLKRLHCICMLCNLGFYYFSGEVSETTFVYIFVLFLYQIVTVDVLESLG